MSGTREEFARWAMWKPDVELPNTWDGVQIALLIDMAKSLRDIRDVLKCSNCLDIPRKLDRIARNTAKPKRKKARVRA